MPLHDDERASEGMARRVIDDEEDRHSRISDALAAFVAAHKLDVNICADILKSVYTAGAQISEHEFDVADALAEEVLHPLRMLELASGANQFHRRIFTVGLVQWDAVAEEAEYGENDTIPEKDDAEIPKKKQRTE